MNNFQKFSAIKRHALLEEIGNDFFEVVIFGGGITGAGIALDAASRGLKVALIEQNDFASGTSSRSTKLVHGGLRYLEKLQFRFVAQLGKERKVLHHNATHNVIPIPVFLPIFKGGQLKKGLSFLGLLVYDYLAGVKKEYRTRWITKEQLIKKYPLINQQGLKGAFLYYEYKTNDGRLVIETLKKASDMGARVINYCEPLELKKRQERIVEARVVDLISNEEFLIKGSFFINATGPWSGGFMKQFDTPMPKSLYPTKGIHLVFSKERFPIREAFYFDTHDQRMIFAIPRQNHVYVGTTDTPYSGDLRKPRVDTTDIDYLIFAVNQEFSGLHLTKTDVLSCWAGIRPLIQDPGKNPDEISRKEELFVSPAGLITITGGKLTGFRLMAKQVVDRIMKQTPKSFVKCKTVTIRASGSEWLIPPDINKLVELADHQFDLAKQTGITAEAFKKFFYRYGTNIEILTEKAFEWKGQEGSTDMLWTKVEVWYSVTHEMTATLSGFFIYRTEMVLFEPEKVHFQLDRVAQLMAELLSWTPEEKENQIAGFKNHWEEYQP